MRHVAEVHVEQEQLDADVLESGSGGDGKRFVVRANEILTAFLELEPAIRQAQNLLETVPDQHDGSSKFLR